MNETEKAELAKLARKYNQVVKSNDTLYKAEAYEFMTRTFDAETLSAMRLASHRLVHDAQRELKDKLQELFPNE